jgi:hypothetical protein
VDRVSIQVLTAKEAHALAERAGAQGLGTGIAAPLSQGQGLLREVHGLVVGVQAENCHLLIRDNDAKFGDAFARVADGSGLEVLATPYQAPKANAVCERFLGSVRRECLDFFLILSEQHLYRTMRQVQAHFNHARPHQGINQHIPCPPEQPEEQATRGEIICQSVLSAALAT